MTGGGSKNPTASTDETKKLAMDRVAEHLAAFAQQRLTRDDPPSDAAVPEKRITINVSLNYNLHRALKKLLLTYDENWQSTVSGLLSVWVLENVRNGVLSPRDVKGIPNVDGSLKEETEP